MAAIAEIPESNVVVESKTAKTFNIDHANIVALGQTGGHEIVNLITLVLDGIPRHVTFSETETWINTFNIIGIVRIKKVPQKSLAFITFKEEIDALNAKEKLNKSKYKNSNRYIEAFIKTNNRKFIKNAKKRQRDDDDNNNNKKRKTGKYLSI